MRHYLTLPIVLTLLGVLAPLSAADSAQKQSQSDVILQEQGELNQNSPVLQSDGSRYQLYSFPGTAGQTVQITLASQAFDSYLILLNENGQKLAENDDRAEGTTDAFISFTLPLTGRYQVIVNSYEAGEQGAFTLTVAGAGRSSGSVSQSPQSCPEDSYFAGNYAQVRTQDGSPLRVRATPNGEVIGAIPSGWQVVVQQTDATGEWTKVRSHFGADYEGEVFASAPDFRAGWVSTAYLRRLGYSCDKPANLRSLLQPNLFGREVTVNEDWVARGDRLAKLARSRDR